MPKPNTLIIKRHYHPNRECQLQALMILLTASPAHPTQTPHPTQAPGDPGEDVETTVPSPPTVGEES